MLKEQKVVTLMADSSPNRDPGLFSILGRVRAAADLPTVRQRIARALAEAAQTPVDAARLDAVRSHLKYAYAASLQSADAVARSVGESIAVTGRPDSMNDLFAALERVTPADLQRVAAKYFIPTNETVVILETEKRK